MSFISTLFERKMIMKYSYDNKEIKKRLKKVREKANLTQNELAKRLGKSAGVTEDRIDKNGKIKTKDTGRTVVTTWESNNNDTLPKLPDLIKICNLFTLDMDFLLGASDIESQDIKTITDTVHISKKTINTLKKHSEYGTILDSMVNDELFDEISNRIKQLGRSFVLEDVITTSFHSEFISFIHKKFDDFYYSTFPMDISKESYVRYLMKQIPFDKEFDPIDFIEQYFLCEGKHFIYNLFENGMDEFYKLKSYEKYNVIISSIAEISYDYFMSLQSIELSKQRLNSMFADIINNAIKQETEKIKANMRLTVKAYSSLQN